MMVAILADALQLIIFPVFAAGAISPADDVLDFGIAAVLDNGGGQRLSKIQKDCSCRRRESRIAPRPATAARS
jgi:hypothetical protein